MLFLILAASSVMDDFSMFILSHIFGGRIGSIAVNKLASAFLLCAGE
jgi:hypothetical protein